MCRKSLSTIVESGSPVAVRESKVPALVGDVVQAIIWPIRLPVGGRQELTGVVGGPQLASGRVPVKACKGHW